MPLSQKYTSFYLQAHIYAFWRYCSVIIEITGVGECQCNRRAHQFMQVSGKPRLPLEEQGPEKLP